MVAADFQDATFGGGIEWIEGELPVALVIGHRRPRLPGELDRDPGSGLVEAPDRHFRLALEDHVVGEGRGQLERAGGQRGEQDGGKEGQRAQGHRREYDTEARSLAATVACLCA